MQDDISNRGEDTGLFIPWVFPTVNIDANPTSLADPIELEMTAEIKVNQSPETLELNQLKQDLQKQIELLQDIHNKYQQMFAEVDKDLLQQIVNLVKNITHKVILKQIDLDKQVMVTMLESALDQIEQKQQYEIFLSSEDYQRLENVSSQSLDTFLKIDTKLEPGDFRIEMPTGEITALMDERLSAFFGV